MKIAVASGKGGTGKTFVTVNLARSCGEPVLVLDCDVEEPNSNLFIQGDMISERKSTVLVPQVNESKCNGCGVCARVCEFNAIAVIGGTPLIFKDLCHSCGACTVLCPQEAMIEVEHEIGSIVVRKTNSIRLIEGQLDIGKALAVPVIRDVKKEAEDSEESVVLIDSPPGTSCPMVWTVSDTDFAVLVAEPTAFGLHDLNLAVGTMQEIGVPFGVVINKYGLGDDRIDKYCSEHHIPILGRIPHDRHIAEVYAQGGNILEQRRYQILFEQLWHSIRQQMTNTEDLHG
jgi:MinD superfamily P-loop ATPase